MNGPPPQKYCKSGRHLMAETRRRDKRSMPYCAECRRIRNRRWWLAHTGNYRLFQRRRNLWSRYGITLDRYDEMLTAQGGKCAICKKPPTRRRLDVDHDHADGHVRGLLCKPCNTALGILGDSVVILKAALDYIRKRSQLHLVTKQELERFRSQA